MVGSIFIGLACFKDYELRHTILDCINKAKHPENLYFGICYQFDNDNPKATDSAIDDLVERYNIKLEKWDWKDSEGGCWARNRAQQFYNNETYSLQFDSHTRFIEHWDEKLINEFTSLLDKTENPIISFLPPSYMRDDENGIDFHFDNIHELDRLNIPTIRELTAQYWPMYGGYTNIKPTNGVNRRVALLYGGFIFSWGKWVKEIEQDPEHYYTGEEFALAVRSFTKGYDIYMPTQILAWHRAHFKTPDKHYNTFENQSDKHEHAMVRLKMLIERSGNLGKYDIGDKRTLAEFEELAGINFKTLEVRHV